MCIDIENDDVFLSILVESLHAKLENCALALTWLVTSKHFRVERIIFVLFPEGLSSHLCFFAISFLPIVSALRRKKQPMLTCKHFITLSPQLRASSSKSCSCSVCLQPSAHLNWVIEQPSRRSTEEAAEKTSTES